MLIAYALLATAIGVEVASTTLLSRTDGFRNIPMSALVLGGYALSIFLLAQVVKTIPTYIAYAVWAGAGTALVAAVAIVLRGEPATAAKVIGVVLVVAGVVLLNVTGAEH